MKDDAYPGQRYGEQPERSVVDTPINALAVWGAYELGSVDQQDHSRHCVTASLRQLGSTMITLGVILLIVGLLIHSVSFLIWIGVVILIIGLVLFALGAMGKAVGGRKHYF